MLASLSLALYVLSVYSCPSESIDHKKLHISQLYAHIFLVYASKILGQYDLYFSNNSYFTKFLKVALLFTSLNLEP